MNNKAMLITMGVFFLGGLLLSLAIIASSNTNTANQRVVESANFVKLRLADDSIQSSISEIFRIHSKIKLNISENSVGFKEDILAPQSLNVKNKIGELQTAINNIYPDPALNPKNTLKVTFETANINAIENSFALRILPQDVDYIHDYSTNTLYVIPKVNTLIKEYQVAIPGTPAVTSWTPLGTGTGLTLSVFKESGCVTAANCHIANSPETYNIGDMPVVNVDLDAVPATNEVVISLINNYNYQGQDLDGVLRVTHTGTPANINVTVVFQNPTSNAQRNIPAVYLRDNLYDLEIPSSGIKRLDSLVELIP